jgi:Predicted oxidoreductases of the aldo/keto reductase family
MEYVALGKTGLMVSRTAFGALPIQRVTDTAEAVSLLRTAYEGGINFFDTARSYTDSEEKLGLATDEIRKDLIIATKSAARNGADLKKDLETSLRNLQTDYIDLYQLHNPSFVPQPDGADGLYDALLEAKKEGKIRFFGITNHSRQLATEAVESGLYDTLQYPFSYLADEADQALVQFCSNLGVGFIAMKALSGGLITNIPAAFAWIRQFEEVIPIWGMQKMGELQQFLGLEQNPVQLDDDLKAAIERDRSDLAGNFCRGCGYCLPCPANIPINNANRMSQLLRRSPTAQWLTPEWQELMGRIENCTKCGICAKRCPYGLKPFETLPGHLADYRTFLK